MSLQDGTPLRTQHTDLRAWIPALIAVAVICAESTNGMGLTHTNAMLGSVVRWTGHQPTEVDPFNRLLRKLGHFTGYGLLGVCFAQGWLTVVQTRTRLFWKAAYLRAGLLGAASALFVASCDEFHQRFLPSRQASLHDVFLDSCGAVTLIAAAGLLVLRREALSKLRTAAQVGSQSYIPQQREPAFSTT